MYKSLIKNTQDTTGLDILSKFTIRKKFYYLFTQIFCIIYAKYVDFLNHSLKSIQFTEFATQWISTPCPVINTQRRKSLETYWTSHLLTRLATQWASLAVQTLPTCIFYVGCQFRWEQEAWGVAWKLQQICILKLLFHYVVKHFTKFPYLQWRHKVLRQARFSIIFRSETLPGLKKKVMHLQNIPLSQKFLPLLPQSAQEIISSGSPFLFFSAEHLQKLHRGQGFATFWK